MRSLLPILAVLTLIGTACSPVSSSSATPPPTVPPSPAPATPTPIDVATLDPCSLLDPQELGPLFGAELLTGEPQPDADGYATCSYHAADASTSVTVLVSRTPVDAAEGEAAVEALPPGSGAEELHGVGGVAWFGYCPQCPAGDTTLTVIEPPLEFSISLALPAGENARRIALEGLARGAIERLGL
ncbi:MAG TPA: DUF3558 family protein [Candidatus Limnocylindria bacterium]